MYLTTYDNNKITVPLTDNKQLIICQPPLNRGVLIGIHNQLTGEVNDIGYMYKSPYIHNLASISYQQDELKLIKQIVAILQEKGIYVTPLTTTAEIKIDKVDIDTLKAYRDANTVYIEELESTNRVQIDVENKKIYLYKFKIDSKDIKRYELPIGLFLSKEECIKSIDPIKVYPLLIPEVDKNGYVFKENGIKIYTERNYENCTINLVAYKGSKRDILHSYNYVTDKFDQRYISQNIPNAVKDYLSGFGVIYEDYFKTSRFARTIINTTTGLECCRTKYARQCYENRINDIRVIDFNNYVEIQTKVNHWESFRVYVNIKHSKIYHIKGNEISPIISKGTFRAIQNIIERMF